MRFITEFKNDGTKFDEQVTSYRKECGQNKLAKLLADSFNWQNPVNGNPLHHRLEIEAFPMDKWVEFKQKVSNVLGHGSREEYELLYLIKELESFGKPSGDGITNQQANDEINKNKKQ